MPTSNPTAALLRFLGLSAVVFAFVGCASADDADSGDAVDDLTSADHGTMMQKCLDAEQAAIRNASTATVIATRAETKKCFAAANDKTARQLDARRSRTAEPAVSQFKLFRSAANAACVAYVDGVNQGGMDAIDAPGLKSNCGYHVEYAMARLIQTYAQLGGPPYVQLWGIRRNEQPACYAQFENDVTKIRACVETGVEQTILTASPASLRFTVKAINVGNVALCEALVKRSTKAATVLAQDECRTEAAISLQQTEARQPH